MKNEQDKFIAKTNIELLGDNKTYIKKQKVSRKNMGGTLQSQNKFPMDWNE